MTRFARDSCKVIGFSEEPLRSCCRPSIPLMPLPRSQPAQHVQTVRLWAAGVAPKGLLNFLSAHPLWVFDVYIERIRMLGRLCGSYEAAKTCWAAATPTPGAAA